MVRRKVEGDLTFPAVAGVPVAVEDFLARLLSVDPKARPPSALAVAEELQSLLRKPAPAPEPTTLAPPKAKGMPVTGLLLGVIVLTVVLLAAWFWAGVIYRALGVVVGIMLVISGVVLASLLRRWIAVRRTEVERVSGNLLLTSKSRTDLSATLALEVNSLIAKVRKVDDRILATSLALMVSEFQAAEQGQMRQAAIMNVVQLLEKLTNRLSPWYVRHEKLLAVAVTAVGIVSGVTTVTASIIKILKGQ